MTFSYNLFEPFESPRAVVPRKINEMSLFFFFKITLLIFALFLYYKLNDATIKSDSTNIVKQTFLCKKAYKFFFRAFITRLRYLLYENHNCIENLQINTFSRYLYYIIITICHVITTLPRRLFLTILLLDSRSSSI